MGSAQHVLDQVQSLTRIDTLAAEPGTYIDALAGEIGPAATIDDLVARDAQLAAALAAIDTMIARAMKIRLEHALADDSSIGPPTRAVFASTVVSYAGSLDVLAQRARDVSARGGGRDPDRTAQAVRDAADSVLVLRGALRDGVLALIAKLAAASAPDANTRARDRRADEPSRKRWSAVRRDLETIAATPEAVLAAPMPARLAAWPEQIDEPDPEAEPKLSDLLELD